MKFSELRRSVCVIFLACVTLSGCSASPHQSLLEPDAGAPSPTRPLSPLHSGAMGATSEPRPKNDRGMSWMDPSATRDDLLYVSNLQNVTVYSYRRGKHVGTLRGFYRPLGECTDRSGDVFIANQDTVVEYKHGGTTPIQTLTFPGYSSGGCASDPTTDDLAVTWDAGVSSGYVAIYQHATGTPTLYSNGNMLFNFCGYDDSGNLFVDGATTHGDLFKFAELPKHGMSLLNITLNQAIEFGGNVQWDGKYVTVADAETYKIYRFTITGSNGTLKGTVNLGNATSLYQTWIGGKKAVGADILGNTVWYWSYPAGGAAVKSITKSIFRPYGVTISKG